jgi:hypothetical protein
LHLLKILIQVIESYDKIISIVREILLMRINLLTVPVSLFLLGLNSTVFASTDVTTSSAPSASAALAPPPGTSAIPQMCKDLVGDCSNAGYNFEGTKGNNVLTDCVALLMSPKPRKPARLAITQNVVQHVVECKNKDAPILQTPAQPVAATTPAASAPGASAEPSVNVDPGD